MKKISISILTLILLISACSPSSITPTEFILTDTQESLPTISPTEIPITPTFTPMPTPIVALIEDGIGQNDGQPFNPIKVFQGPGPEKDFPPPTEVADFDIATGIDNVLAVSNFGIGLYEKSGNLLEYKSILDFFRPALESQYPSAYKNSEINDGEIRSLYDPLSERFFFVASTAIGQCNIDFCISYYVLAVSKSNSPKKLTLDDWYIYTFDGNKFENDGYPRMVDFTEISVNEDVVALTCQCVVEDEDVLAGNISSIQAGVAKILLLPKNDLINGQQPEKWNEVFKIQNPFSPSYAIDQLEPVILRDGKSPLYFLYHTGSQCSLAVLRIDDPLENPQVTTKMANASGNCTANPNSPQPDTAPDIKTQASPLSARPILQNGSIWGTHNVVNPKNSKLSAIRWYEIDVSNWSEKVSFTQDNLYAIDNLSVFYSAITINPQNDIMMIFGSSSDTSYPTLHITGRLNDDPPGTMRPSILIAKGEASIGINRFGDYFGITLDPIDNSVWAYGQYAYNSCRWASMIAQLNWDTISDDLVVHQENIILNEPQKCGNSIEGYVQSISGKDLSNYTVSACPISGGICTGFPLQSDNTFRLILPAGQYFLSVNSPEGSNAGWYFENGIDETGENSTKIILQANAFVTGITIVIP